MYKVYDKNGNAHIFHSIREARIFANLDAEQTKALFMGRIVHNGEFSVINYS